MPGRDQLVDRFLTQQEINKSASKRAAAAERATRTRQIQSEAGQALASVETNNVTELPVLAETILRDPLDSVTSDQHTTFGMTNVETCPVHEQDLRIALQASLRVAEDRIAELDQQLTDARRDLKNSILQDQNEEIQRQRRVIENLIVELRKIEDERDALRNQFRESETRVYELERQKERLLHGHKDCRVEVATVETDILQLSKPAKGEQPRNGSKNIGRSQSTSKPNNKALKVGRRHGFPLYLTT
jgi:predicted RNase H-like nuclease (RuvC/YqgF family)